MKKQIILLLLFSMHQLSYRQNNIATKVRCTDAMAQNANGRWIKSTDRGTINSKEAYNRLDEIQNMILKIYPNRLMWGYPLKHQ